MALQMPNPFHLPTKNRDRLIGQVQALLQTRTSWYGQTTPWEMVLQNFVDYMAKKPLAADKLITTSEYDENIGKIGKMKECESEELELDTPSDCKVE